MHQGANTSEEHVSSTLPSNLFVFKWVWELNGMYKATNPFYLRLWQNWGIFDRFADVSIWKDCLSAFKQQSRLRNMFLFLREGYSSATGCTVVVRVSYKQQIEQFCYKSFSNIPALVQSACPVTDVYIYIYTFGAKCFWCENSYPIGCWRRRLVVLNILSYKAIDMHTLV